MKDEIFWVCMPSERGPSYYFYCITTVRSTQHYLTGWPIPYASPGKDWHAWQLGLGTKEMKSWTSIDPALKLTGPAATRFTPQPINDALR
jgi:hypothetical protein